MIGEAERGRVFSAPSEVVKWAVANNPDIDYEKVHKRLRAIRGQLDAFAKDFPVEGLTTCVEFLDEIDADELKASREPAPVATAVPEPAREPEPEAASKPREAALDDALSEIYGEAA